MLLIANDIRSLQCKQVETREQSLYDENQMVESLSNRAVSRILQDYFTDASNDSELVYMDLV